MKKFKLNFFGYDSMCPTESSSTVAKFTVVSHESVRKILKTKKFFLYKMHILQSLLEGDPDKRIQFCGNKA